MASSPQGIYTGLKTKMKNAYYTDNMVNNLENFRAEASTFLSGPGEYQDLSFLKICENLEGNGDIGWNKLENLKTLVQSTTGGKKQLLDMINDAEREIQPSLPGSARWLPPKSDAQKLELRDEVIVLMEEEEYRVNEGGTAFLDCTVEPKPKCVIWRKGDKNRVDKRIPMNNKKYYCSGPPNPTLVIRSAEKKDAAHYQCTAKDIDTANNIKIEVKGDTVLLEVASDANESDRYRNDRSRSRSRNRQRESCSRSPEDRYQRKQTSRASGANESDSYRIDRSRSRSRDRYRESRSRSPEDRYQRKTRELTMQIWKSGCGMKFTIIHHDEIALTRVASIITQEFVATTGEKQRLDTVDLETQCIRVLIEIKAANSLSEAPAVCLAEQFKHYLLDGGLQLSDESNAVLDVDEPSIKITPEHMPEDGHPLVNISHQEFSVPNSESVILQTYIISSPPAWSIEWFQIKAGDNEIYIEIDSRKYYGGSELSPSLIIRNANVDDQGLYICRATNNNGTGCSNKAFVRINNEPAETEDKPGILVKDTSDIPEPAGTEDKPGILVKDTSDIQEPAGTEDKHGILVKDTSDIQEPAGTEDKPGILVKDTSDIQEPAGTEDKPGILVKDTSDIQEPAGTEDKPGILVKDTSDIQESTRAEDKPGKLLTDISDIPESTRAEDKPGKLLTDISDIPAAHDYDYDFLDNSPDEQQLQLPDYFRLLPDYYSDSDSAAPLYRPPNQPRAMQVTNADRASLAISWNRPLRIVGSPVTGYIVEKRTAWTQVSKVSANELSCVADKLIEGTEYEFRITAVNEYGKGKALESDQTYMAKSPYKPLQTRDSPESAERYISDIKESLQTGDSPETTERHISGIKDLVPIEVWDRVPSKAEIKQIVTNIDNKFSNLFLELGLSPQIIEQHGQGHPVTFQVRMKALLRCWIDSSHAKATIGSLLTAMKLCQMDWHTTAQIWSA